MSKLGVAMVSGAVVAMVMILMSDMPYADDVERTVHQAKRAIKEQL